MAKQKWTIYIGLVLLILLVVQLCLYSAKEETAPFSLELTTADGQEQVLLWKQGGGGYYGFLPAFSDLEDTYIRLHTTNPVQLNGILLEDGMNCGTFATDKPQVLTHTVWGRECTDTVTFLRSANIPSMHIDTKSGSMEYIHEEKGNEEPGELRLYTKSGVQDYAGNVESIKGRGNSTWSNWEKKPYSITLAEEADLIGLGKAKEWILLANAFDASNLRNQIVYQFAKAIGLPFSPDSTWVDVYLNGEYAGLYLLCERNEIHPERVAISETGSILVSQELEGRLILQGYPYVLTQAGQVLRVRYPLSPDAAELEEITKQFQSMENALLSEDGIDPITGKSWQELIDLDSWARKYLVEEVFGNGDAGIISQYFYVDGNDDNRKVYAGPVWDCDRTMGSDADWYLKNPQTFLGNRLQAYENHESPWMFMLYQKEAFYNRVTELYQKEWLPQLEVLLEDTIETYVAVVEQASKMNNFRWFNDESSLDSRICEITQFMDDRIAFLNRVWINNEAYYRIRADHGFGRIYAHYVVFVGEKLTGLPTFDDTQTHTFAGWYYTDTDEPFDPEAPITEDTEIYAKWVEKAEKAEKNVKQLLKLVPLGVIAVMGVGLLWVEMKRGKKRGDERCKRKWK